METSENRSSWDQIRQGVKDAETLIGQKKYNLSMIKSRQTLEFMVRCLAEKACIVEGDLNDTIDELYQGRWISKATCEHYHKIRMLGNRAVHEGNDNAYDANQAYHLLSQEVYTFANDYNSKMPKPVRKKPASSASRNRSRRRSPQKSNGLNLDMNNLIKILIGIFCVVLIVLVIRLILPDKKENDVAELTTTEELFTEPDTEPETMAETTPAAVYKTTTVLNVRSEPSTSGSKLGQIEADVTVDYIRDYDDEWAIINYNGQEAYVASQYLVHD